jgi:hypothetical protein
VRHLPVPVRRLEGANRTLSIEDVQARFNAGLTEIDRDVVGPFADLLERGEYLSCCSRSSRPLFIRYAQATTSPRSR